eukprot:comp19823_c0_seq1/m.23840 comp19823_c0_seq1/g.23840  ORF comp19823_c0_seq1/g.23840 comp19823_c0_seq1/m.23840 type:complete len:726 (-) comp19823_c0_seq1:36-2213(-)
MDDKERVEVGVVGPPPSDQDTGRCRLPTSLVASFPLAKFGEPVWVYTHTEALLCTLFPNQDRFAKEATADPLVSKPQPSDTQANSVVAVRGPVGVCNRVQVTVKMKGGTGDGKTPAAVQREVFSLLLHRFVSTGCIVRPTNSSWMVASIKIVGCEGESPSTSYGDVWRVSQTSLVEISDEPPLPTPQPASTSTVQDVPTVGGLEGAKRTLMEVVGHPIKYKRMFETMGLQPPKGVLLYGPPGVGKTLLVSAVARECGAHLITVNGPSIYGAYLGESEQNLRRLFLEASSSAQTKPTVLFIDEIDALCPSREQSATAESRVVATLLTLMDGIKARGDLVVVGATNRPNAIDRALRRPGRFDREIHIDVPSEGERKAILEVHSKTLPLVNVDMNLLAHVTKGYVGADLAGLCREAATAALKRYTSSGGKAEVSMGDFEHALAVVCPSTQRGSLVDFERKTCDSIGGLESVKQALREAIEWPIIHRESFQRLGLGIPRGVLLYGPPGCSKTTLVKAIASTSNCTFLAVSGAQVYSPYVGEAEKTIRELFHRARQGAPAVVFMDEIDAMVGRRGQEMTSAGVSERILSTLLNEMDGVVEGGHVVCVAATNRPDMLDEALMRPGRFDKIIFVPPPDFEGRLSIFGVHTKRTPMAGDVDLKWLAQQTDLFSGADIENVCREAALHALRRDLQGEPLVERSDFDAALRVCQPSLTANQMAHYVKLSTKMGSS